MAYCVRSLCCAALMGVLATASFCHAAPRKLSAGSGQLMALASENFPNLTRAERALLEFADVENPDRGEWAVAGTSADSLDPSNDPQNSARWSKDRDIRARLLRWLCRDRAATEKVDPRGIRILGAHLTGALDLSYLNVPFAIALIRCAISEPVNFESTEITRLDLDGCYTAEISAPGLHVLHDLSFGQPERARGEFRASGEVYLLGAKIGGYVWMVGAHFHHSKVEPHAWGTPFKMALVLNNAEVKSDIVMTRGFESDGAVLIFAATLGGDVNCAGGHFLNPGNIALGIDGSTSYGAELVALPPFGPFEANGIVSMVGTHFSNILAVDHAIFRGKLGEPHGLSAGGMTIRTAMVWQNVTLENDAVLDLGGASVGFLLDDQSSWPAPGKLLIDGLTYAGFGSAVDARTRLRWLRLQPGFHSQPYRQFANVLRQSGDDAGAIDVLIAEEDARYLNSPLLRRVWAGFLKATIGYGHEPLLTVIWSIVVVLCGAAMVMLGNRAGVMRRTWPESVPATQTNSSYERLQPILYSLDVFVPFVNFHQEAYWWPDANLSGECDLLGRRVRFSGSILRSYLWLQIVAGWLLSAIFLAGVSGLIRND